jgi:hypothetical protein
MKTIFLPLLFVFQCYLLRAQGVGIGTTTPHGSAQLDISSTTKGLLVPRMTYVQRISIPTPATGLLVYQTDNSSTNAGFYTYNGTGWDLMGADHGWRNNASGSIYALRPVGINNTNPDYSLDVTGTIRSSSLITEDAAFGKPSFTTSAILTINAVGLSLPAMIVNDETPTIQLQSSGADKGFVQLSGDNLRIGTNSENTNGKLVVRVGGADQAVIDNNGDMVLEGDMVVRGSRGVLYNAASSTGLRYYTRTAAFTVNNLVAHGITAEGSIGFVGFTRAPEVIVGDIVTTGGTTGPLYKCQLVIYDVTAAGCKCRISNTSNSTINQNITWNIICIGN